MSNQAAERCPHLSFALSFDVSLQEIFASLCSGGSLVIVGEEIRRDLLALARRCEENVTRVFLPFAVLEDLIQALNTLETPPAWLREFVTAGEQLLITPSIERLSG